jgi:pilus assembly protein CpaF
MTDIAGADVQALARRVHAIILDATRGVPDADLVDEVVRREGPLLSATARRAVGRLVSDRFEGYGPLQSLLDDDTVTDIYIDGPDRVTVERAGRVTRADVQLDAPAVAHLVERLIGPSGRRVDVASPIVDARLAGGARVNVVVPPIAVDGPYVAVRRFHRRPLPLAAFGSSEVVRLVRDLALARANVLVSGGTGAGKTSFLAAVLADLGAAAGRVVTIEDAAELPLDAASVVRLEARPANADGAGLVTLRDLVRTALRLRPDRIVVGEVRGGEALDLVHALNTGHAGSMSTVHANDPGAALRRVQTLALIGDAELPPSVAEELVRTGIDVVVHLVRGPDGGRSVTDVVRVDHDGPWPGQPLVRDGVVLGSSGGAP